MPRPRPCSRDLSTVLPSYRRTSRTWESRVPAAAAELAQTQKELDNLQVAVASVKATMVLQRLPLLQVQELLDLYADKEKGLKGKLKDLGREIDELKKSQQEQVESQNALRVQLSIIQAKDPAAVTPELQQAFLTYLNLAGDRDRLMTRVLDQLEQRRRLLEQEQELLAGLTPQLKQLEADWKGQLLKRPAASGSFPGAGGPGLEEPGRHPPAGLGLAQWPGGIRTPERLYLEAPGPHHRPAQFHPAVGVEHPAAQ